MCGLVGVAGEIGLKEEKMFGDMLMLDTIRGKHSTGVAAINSVGNNYFSNVVKAAKSAPEFMELEGYKSIGRRVNKILLGHNRFATRGAITDDNAHPFEFDKVVGAHNGSLYTFNKMFEHEKYTVDSQALYSNLNQHGVDDTWGKVDGAAALTWIDLDNLTVNFLRNKERPLFYAVSKSGRTLFWASEPWMIMVAAMRQNVEIEDKVHDVVVNSLYTFTCPLTADKKDKVTFSRREVKPYVAPAYYSSGYRGWESWGSQRDDDYDKSYEESRAKGQAFLKTQGAINGDKIEFTVDVIKDHKDTNGRFYCNIKGTSLLGVPVFINNLTNNKGNEDIIDLMWQNEDAVFSGHVSYADKNGIAISHYELKDAGYSVTDVIDQLVKDEEKEKENLYTAVDNTLEALGEGNHSPEESNKDGVTFRKISYKISCSYCREMTNEYYVDRDCGLAVCCANCWNNHIGAMSVAERSAIKLGSMSKH